METFVKAHLTGGADKDLGEMLNETNTGFASGKLTRTQLLSWIVSSFRRRHFEKEREQIRADHFDKVAHLNSIIKQVKDAAAKGQEVDIEKLLSPLKIKKPISGLPNRSSKENDEAELTKKGK